MFESTRKPSSTAARDDGYIEFTSTDDGFFAVLGSDLGKSFIHLLLNVGNLRFEQ